MICLYFVLHFACTQAKISSIRHAFPLARSLAHFTRTRNKVMPFAIQYTTMANEMNVEITCLVYNLIHYTIENIYLYVNSYAAIKMIMEKGNFSLSLFLSSHIFFLSNVRMWKTKRHDSDCVPHIRSLHSVRSGKKIDDRKWYACHKWEKWQMNTLQHIDVPIVAVFFDINVDIFHLGPNEKKTTRTPTSKCVGSNTH